jgi:hypothetical protein
MMYNMDNLRAISALHKLEKNTNYNDIDKSVGFYNININKIYIINHGSHYVQENLLMYYLRMNKLTHYFNNQTLVNYLIDYGDITYVNDYKRNIMYYLIHYDNNNGNNNMIILNLIEKCHKRNPKLIHQIDYKGNTLLHKIICKIINIMCKNQNQSYLVKNSIYYQYFIYILKHIRLSYLFHKNKRGKTIQDVFAHYKSKQYKKRQIIDLVKGELKQVIDYHIKQYYYSLNIFCNGYLPYEIIEYM